jgi:hypothetical protein
LPPPGIEPKFDLPFDIQQSRAQELLSATA